MKSKNQSNTLNEEVFWNWFSQNAGKIASNPEDPQLLNELDQHVVQAWPELTWEIGPELSGEWYFALSPNLDRDLVPQANAAIKSAPQIDGWKFHPSRQRKVWDKIFQIEAEDGDVLEIDATDWTYLLLRYPDGENEIVLIGKDAEILAEDERWQAAAIVLESILGEECVLAYVTSFALETALDAKFLGKDKSIDLLPQAFGMECK